MTDTTSSELFETHREETVTRGRGRFRRTLLRTPWYDGPVDLGAVIPSGVGDRLHPKCTVFICEKLAVVATGRTVDVSTVRVGRFARVASRYVRPVGVDLAQSIPERMQYVIDRIGMPRTILACAAAAITRPLRVRGAFYVIAGREARDLDGLHAPYWNTLLPALKPAEARKIVHDVANAIGVPVAIVDINDRGGHVRAVSPGGMPAADILAALDDNPMGHTTQSTPLGLIRAV